MRLILLLSLLFCAPTWAEKWDAVAHDTDSYMSDCFPLYAISDGQFLTGLDGNDADFVITAQTDNGTTVTYQGTADIEAATYGTYSAPTADTDIGWIECTEQAGTYQLQPRDSLLATSGASGIAFCFTDAGTDTVLETCHTLPLTAVTQSSLDTSVAAAVAAFLLSGETTEGSLAETIDDIAGLFAAQDDDLLAYFQLALRSDSAVFSDRSTELALINGDEGSGAGDYDETNSQEGTYDLGFNISSDTALIGDSAVVRCTVNTANFAGSTTTAACLITDFDSNPLTGATGDLEGKEFLVLSGAQIYEARYINDTTWDAVNSELQLTLSRALPDALADAVTAVIR